MCHERAYSVRDDRMKMKENHARSKQLERDTVEREFGYHRRRFCEVHDRIPSSSSSADSSSSSSITSSVNNTVRGSLKLDYPSLCGMLLITPGWRYLYGAY